jgi:outer membrane protein TolC
MVRGEVEQGARPAIDTVEAYAQYYTLQQQQSNAEQLWKNASLELSAFLWLDNGMPYSLTQNVMPEKKALSLDQKNAIDVGQMVAQLTAHPKLQMMDSKLDILELDRKLKMQSLIPKLYVNSAILDYNPYTNSILKQVPADNYKVSLDVSVPLLMREARGGIKAANLKIKEIQTDRQYQLNQLNVKVNSYYNEYTSLTDQIRNYENVQAAYATLYNGEMVKYMAGESTMFLVNSRELKLLEASQKVIELKAKQQKAYAGILYAAGVLM